MIADTLRNRIVTRTCIAIVALVAPASLAYILVIVLVRPEILRHQIDPRTILFAWCLAECLFWTWSTIKYKHRPQEFTRVIPTFEDRQKLKNDCLQIIKFSPDGATEFIEGWFKTGEKHAQIKDIHKDNIKEWYHPS
jgi:hypothetical protein